MKNSKKNLQEMILEALSGKKAGKQSNISQDVELILEEELERKVKPRYLINRAIKKMIDDDMIKEHETEQSSFLSLTATGRQRLRNIKLSSHNHLVPTQWDGYWRMVIVDIPESKKKDQDAIRYILKKAQFVQIKSSIWISPYPLEHMMINMKDDMDLHEELIILVTNKLDAQTEELLQRKFLEN